MICLLLAQAACRNDPLAAPGAGDPAVDAHQARSRGVRGRWRFNTERYRDHGRPPARGRSGTAVLEAEALRGAGGLTVLTVRSFRAGDLEHPAGDLEHLLVRIHDARGRLLLARTYPGPRAGPTFVMAYPHLPAGAAFQVTALVRGLDGRRADVVSVGGVGIALAPDLAITGIGLPDPVYARTPTIVTATVREQNGERGARADCELRVDGRLADRAAGIWVDAGDVVACAFTVTFAEARRYRVGVRLTHVAPAGGARADDRRTADVDVREPGPAAGGPTVEWSASVRWGMLAERDTFRVRWTAPDGTVFFEGASGNRAAGEEQDALLSGLIGAALPFPLTRLELAQAAGGVLLDQAVYDDVAPDGGASAGVACAARGVGTGVEFYLCADPLGFSSVTYRRASGTVTYLSSGYSRTWNGSSYDVDTYVDNTTDAGGPPVVALGGRYAFDVRITAGGLRYVLAAQVPLAPLTESAEEPYACVTRSIPLDVVYSVEACSGASRSFTGVAGTASGTGAVER